MPSSPTKLGIAEITDPHQRVEHFWQPRLVDLLTHDSTLDAPLYLLGKMGSPLYLALPMQLLSSCKSLLWDQTCVICSDCCMSAPCNTEASPPLAWRPHFITLGYMHCIAMHCIASNSLCCSAKNMNGLNSTTLLLLIVSLAPKSSTKFLQNWTEQKVLKKTGLFLKRAYWNSFCCNPLN